MIVASETPRWSKSRMAALKECRRKLFFTSNRANEEKVSRLKNLKNRHLWAGAVLHESIGDLIKQLRQGDTSFREEDVLNRTKLRMREEFKSSLVNAPAEKKGWRLFEHQYRLPVGPDVWQQMWIGVEQSLLRFMKSSWFDRLKTVGPEIWKAVDEVLEFEIDGTKAYAKIDCALEFKDRFVLIDWKTSSSSMKDDFPLTVASLYAHEVWGADPDTLQAFAVSVVDGRQREVPIDSEVLMNAYLQIQEEGSQLTEAFNGFSDSEFDPFKIPLPSDPSICTKCNFKSLCHPEQDGLTHAI